MSSSFSCRVAAAAALVLAVQSGVVQAAEPGGTETAAPADALAQHSVIRGAFRHELTQEFKFRKMNPYVMLVDIANRDTEKFERQFGGSMNANWGPTKKVRGAELLPGKYEAYVACYSGDYQMSMWNTFRVPVDAEPGQEYVLECVGYLGRNGDAHPVIHVKPLQSLAPGVTALSAECVDLSDVPLFPRLKVKKCKSDLNRPR